MAEIHVEPKKQSSNTSWIWIVLALLIAAAVIYYFVTRNNTADNRQAQPVNTTSYISFPMPAPNHTVFV